MVEEQSHRERSRKAGLIWRLVLLALGLALVTWGTRYYLLQGRNLELAGVRDWILSWGPLAPLASLALMVAQALVSPIPFALVVLANGAIFGLVPGMLLSSLGEVLGAAAAYSLARSGLSQQVSKAQLDRYRGKLGFWQMVVLRLIPGLSVDLISYTCGALGVPVRSFLLATWLGLLPRTLLLSAFGEELLDNPQHTLAVGLGCLILALIVWGALRYRFASKAERA